MWYYLSISEEVCLIIFNKIILKDVVLLVYLSPGCAKVTTALEYGTEMKGTCQSIKPACTSTFYKVFDA